MITVNPIVLTALALAVGIRIQEPTQGTSRREPERVQRLEDLAAKTAPEIARAKFFDRLGSSELKPGTRSTIRGIEPPPPPPPAGKAVTPRFDDVGRERICGADAVFLGVPTASRTLMNERRTFLFTDHELRVDTWLKPRQGETSVLVSQAGGEVIVDTRPIVQSTAEVPLLDTARPYIVFAARIPGTDSYTIAGPPIPISEKVGILPRLFPSPPDIGGGAVPLDRLISDFRILAAQCR